MSRPTLSVAPLRLPDFLEQKCQALLEGIQRADSMNVALLAEQRAAGFTEALEWLQVMPPAQTEDLFVLYERALTGRIAELGS
ncbi:hypothetical protein [Pseudomonas sp. Marseille-Q5115]|uniref:hypothetical protein n=1 Tax=Pseudomonas sp. Marseille-Q5115 TaxID=2866593 RepID=UPI001CE4852A|nr:hypothetical protein [Pseudomonas sp. Marseille-Q5115]